MAPKRAAATLATFALAAVLAACGGETSAPIGATVPSSTNATGGTSAAGAATPAAAAKVAPATGSPAKTTSKPAVFDDPCSVLTLAEVQVAAPGSQAGRSLGTGSDNGSCRWLAVSPVEPQITFNFEWVEGAAAPLKAAMESSLKAPGARRVDVGDGAIIRGDDGGYELRFIRGEFNASLSASPRGKLTEDGMITLAKLVASRLSP